MSFLQACQKWRWSRFWFLGLVKPLQEREEGKLIHMYFTSWQQVLSPWTKHQFWVYQQLGPSILTLSRFRVFYSSRWFLSPIIWGICQCLLYCRFVPLVLSCQNMPKSLLCCAHRSRTNLCWTFYSCLDLLCRPFPGINSLHHVFSTPCREI